MTPPRLDPSPHRSTTQAVLFSSQPLPASARRTGMPGSRHDRRHHPRHWPGRTRSGHGRGNGLPNPRCRRRHGEGQRYRRARSPRRRWSVGHGFPAAVPGRPARRACHPIEGCRDDGARFGLPGRPCRGVWDSLPMSPRTGRPMASSPQPPTGRAGCRLARWQRAVERSRDWELEG